MEQKKSVKIDKERIKRSTVDTDTVKIDTTRVPLKKIPFGFKFLANANWTKQEYISAVFKNGKNFQNFPDMETSKYFQGPVIKVKKYILVGGDSSIVKDKRSFKNNFLFRLPDISIYQCYYVYEFHNFGDDDKNNPIIDSTHRSFIDLGSLILYNSKSETANILNVFCSYSYPGAQYEGARHFYLSADKKIRILNTGGDEDTMTDMSEYEVKVLDDGQIILKYIKMQR